MGGELVVKSEALGTNGMEVGRGVVDGERRG